MDNTLKDLNQATREFPIRSWKEFIKGTKYETPTTFKQLVGRVETNLQYFLTNYFICTLAFFVYSAVTRTLFLISAGIILPIWIYLLFVRDIDEPFDFRKYGANVKLTPREFYTYFGLFSAVVLGLTSGLIMVVAIGLVLLHAACKTRSMKTKFNAYVGKMKGTDIASGLS